VTPLEEIGFGHRQTSEEDSGSGQSTIINTRHPFFATQPTAPRREVIRSLMLNHWYHRRGQLSVYLRLLDVPVPVIYGRSADENPFA
jgi:uncharacterized damage-inducible protein DinB